MNPETEDRAGIKIVRIAGDLDGMESGPLRTILSDLVEERGARIVVDMTDVGFINSTGLSALITLTARANTHESRLVLAAVSPFVAGVLETTRLDRFFDVFATVDAAVAALNSAQK